MFGNSNYYGSGQPKYFPKNLKKIFPWKNFYGSSLRNYILKEECVGGAYSFETRYPFLDKQVVQEFLWLNSKLKNSNIKAPLFHYMKKHNYPFHTIKYGFNFYK